MQCQLIQVYTSKPLPYSKLLFFWFIYHCHYQDNHSLHPRFNYTNYLAFFFCSFIINLVTGLHPIAHSLSKSTTLQKPKHICRPMSELLPLRPRYTHAIGPAWLMVPVPPSHCLILSNNYMQNDATQVMFLNLRLRCPFLQPAYPQFSLFVQGFNSWALRIRDAPSPHKAFTLYAQMHRQSLPRDSFSILFMLKACAPSWNLSILHHLHAHITKLGFTTHVYVATSLLYAYVLNSLQLACLLFDEMPHKNTVTWNTMIVGYSKSGDVDTARQLFDIMPSRDLASWSAMIAAYINNRNYRRALVLFQDMIVSGLNPDQMATGSILNGCAYMGSLGLLAGKSVHGFVVKNKWELNSELGTVLVDMYAKCGSLKNACQVFHFMPERNVRTWTALICGSAQHGYCKEALVLFETMRSEGVEPNELTFTGVLSACVRAGLVQEGRKYFNMIEEYGLEIRIQHYGCMVDLLGKSGLLEEAYGVIKNMRLEPNVIVWSSFLSACKQHKKFDIAHKVIQQILARTEPENHGGIYSLISDLYVLEDKWDDAEKIRKLMNRTVRKVRAYSLIRSGL